MFKVTFRTLLKTPIFTSLAVVTLALGIASTITIFSIVNSIVINPLPYRESERLVKIWELKKTEPSETAKNSVSFPNFADWVQSNKSFAQLAAVQTGVNYHLTSGEEPYRVEAARVSWQFFPIFGQPFKGRGFAATEDKPGGEPVAVVSESLWRNHLGGDPNLVGKTITLSGKPRTVVGIMPASFGFPSSKVELWVPLALDPVGGSRWARFLDVYGRLAPGVSLERAREEMSSIAAGLEKANPGPDTGMGTLLVPLKQVIVGDTEKPLLLLLGAVGFVLLIAIVNVTNLLLVRSISRQRDVAVALAFGADQPRIRRQFLAEGMMLAFCGGLLGVLLAFWGVRLLVALSPGNVPRLEEVTLDVRAVLLALGISLLVGVVLGLAPAFAAAAPNLSRALREGGRGTEGASRRRIRTTLVVGEIALAVVLLIGASQLIAGFVRLFRVDPGFRPNGVLTMQFDLPRASYPEGEQKAAFYDRLLQRLAVLPGVSGVGMINYLPLSGADTTWTFHIDGRPPEKPGDEPKCGYRVVDSNYFHTMGIPLVRGSVFTPQDHQKGATSVIINQAMAQTFWPKADPLGKRFKLGDAEAKQPWLTVVGVVGNVKHTGLGDQAEAEMYVPYSPEWFDPMTLVIRTPGDPLAQANPVRQAVKELDPKLPLFNIKPLSQVLSDSLAQPRFNLVLMSLFAVLALVLAAVGIYGVMAQAVVQQRRRIAIQMALGATQRDVLVHVLKQGMVLALTGVAIGMAVAAGLGHLLSSLVFGMGTTAPLAFLEVAVLFIAVSLLAIYIPAFRAARVDPIVCLKAS